MLEGVEFSYDGIKSTDMGLLNVIINGGMFEETFLSSFSIDETKVKGKDRAYFQGKNRDALQFNLTFAFEDEYDEKKIREVARWLSQDYYKPFYTTDNPNRIYYCMLDGDSSLVHNGSKKGYITLAMKCDSPYSYTPSYIKEGYVFSNTKIATSISEDTFNSSMGTMENIDVNINNNLVVTNNSMTWFMLNGKKWSDL